MDIIAQLQEHASKIAYIAFNAAGTIQRDAPPSQLFQDYPRPPAVSADALTTVVERPKEMVAAFVDVVKQVVDFEAEDIEFRMRPRGGRKRVMIQHVDDLFTK